MVWRPLPPEPGTSTPRPLDASLARLAASLGAPSPAVLSAVFSRWPDIVGAELAAHAKPLSLRGGVLVLGVDQPAWASQLGYLKTGLLSRIVETTGSTEVTDIRMKVTGR